MDTAGEKLWLYPSDMAVLELREPRRDLPCSVNPIPPVLGFDLRYHVGFEASVPLRDLAGSENLLTIVFRVIPEGREKKAAYFMQRASVPQIAEGSRGDAVLQGIFDLGEGKYSVDWLMRDRQERICSSFWDVAVDVPDDKEEQIRLAIKPGVIEETETDFFKEDPPVVRAQQEKLLNVKVLVNFAPQLSDSTIIRPLDTNTLVSVLRNISRNPQMGKFSLVAFNLQQRRVFYRQENDDRIDFPSLGKALKSSDPGTIDYQRLAQSETAFLEDLIEHETAGEGTPDALIFVGPKAMLDENVPKEALREIGKLNYPIFYLNCNLYPQRTPWRDAIGNVVKFFRGSEYIISRPRDAWLAVKDLVMRASKAKPQPAPPEHPSGDR